MKVAVKIILLIALIFIGMIADSMTPVINNDLAMTQLENSDALLVMTSTYNRVMPVIDFAYGALICLMVFLIARDVVNLVKSSEHET